MKSTTATPTVHQITDDSVEIKQNRRPVITAVTSGVVSPSSGQVGKDSLDHVVKYAVESGASRLKTHTNFNVRTSMGAIGQKLTGNYAAD